MVRLTLPLFATLALVAAPAAADNHVVADHTAGGGASAAVHEQAADAHAHNSQPLDLAVALEKSEAAIGEAVGDYTLVNADGNTLNLADFRGKPLVISPIYASCPMICPMTTQHLIKAVSRAQKVFGPDRFAVLTVSFDPQRDTPARLAAFMSDQDVDLRNWQIAVGDHETTGKFMADLGFSYHAGAGGFDHVTQTTILDGDGRVHRQVYGDAFPIQVFLEPMKEVIFGTGLKSLSVNNLVDRIRFICTV
ncbi:MAG TPA: SCO family protein, partial [Afifellaceae bacterium]|nr:SCO family protein [Afifellaceae bacterium]